MKPSLLRRCFRLRVLLSLLVLSLGVAGFVLHRLSDKLLQRFPGVAHDWHQPLLETPKEFGFDLEPFSFDTSDGLEIQVLAVSPAPDRGTARKQRAMERRLGALAADPADAPRGTILVLHGRKGQKEDILPMAERFTAAGFRCLIWDSRGHGASEGSFVTYGFREKEDLRLLLDEAENRFGELGPIGVFGHSMGGAIALQALEVEPRIGAVVSVNAFTDLSGLVQLHTSQRLGKPGSLLVAPVFAMASLRSGSSFAEVQPGRSAAISRVPILFVAGENDAHIPASQSRLAHLARPESTHFELVAGAGHHNVYGVGGEALYEQINRFFLEELLGLHEPGRLASLRH